MTDDTTNGRIQWGALMRHLLGLQAQDQDQGQPNIPGSLPYGPTSPTVDNRYLQDNNARQVASAYGNAQDISPMARALMHPSPEPPQPLPPNPHSPPQDQLPFGMTPPTSGNPQMQDANAGSLAAHLSGVGAQQPPQGPPPNQLPFGMTPPTGQNQQLADANSGALASHLAGLDGPQPGDDAPHAPVPVAKPKRGGGKAKGKTTATPAQSAWNERSAYDGEPTEPPTPSQGDMDAAMKAGYGPTPTPEDMAAATKVHPAADPAPGPTATPADQGSPQGPGILSKIGGALSSAFHNADLGDLLSGVSTGLLLGKNVKEGTGIGLQLADARINRRRQMEQEQGQFDARMGLQNRGLDLEQRGQDQRNDQFGQELGLKRDQMGQQGQQFDQQMGLDRSKMGQQADQFGQSLGVQKDDLALRRDENALVNRHQAQQLALQEREFNERASQDKFGNSLNLQQLADARRRSDLEYGGPQETKFLPDADGQGTVAVKSYRDGRVETQAVPGVSAGLQIAGQNNKADLAAEQGMAAKATNALSVLDDTNRVDQILAKDPTGIGPDVVSGTQRWLATTLGLPGQDPVAELRNLKANQQLDLAASKLKGQGAVSDRERTLISQAASNVDTMSPGMLKELNEVRRKQATADMGVYDDYLSKNPEKTKGAVAFDYTNRRGRALSQGGARSGEPPVSSGGRAVSVGGKSINYTVE